MSVGRPGACRRFEDAAHLEQFQHRGVMVELDDEAQRVEQRVGGEARDVGPVALAHVEDADQRQRAHCLTQRTARQAEAGREVGLARQSVARPQPAGDDHVLQLLDRFVGDGHSAPPVI